MKVINIDGEISALDEVVSDLYHFLTGDKPHAKLLMMILDKKTRDANCDLMSMANGNETVGYIIRDQQRKGKALALQEVLNLPAVLREALDQAESS